MIALARHKKIAFSNEKHQCWPIQKKYLKTIGQFNESVEDVVDPILQYSGSLCVFLPFTRSSLNPRLEQTTSSTQEFIGK
jgi:hypothetical protein